MAKPSANEKESSSSSSIATVEESRDQLYPSLQEDGSTTREHGMNIISRLAIGLMLTVGVQSGVQAADLFSDVGTATSTHDWSGFYAGVVGGAGILNTTMSDNEEEISYGSVDLSGWGASLGGTVGYNVQFGAGVVGVEADVNWSSLGVGFLDDNYGTQHDRNWDWYSTLRLRAGLALDNAMIYATAGAAFVGVNFKGDYSPPNDCGDYYGYCIDETVVGVTIGAGAEYMLTDNMSVKVEGLYIGLPTSYADDVYLEYADNYQLTSNAFVARAGLNFHF